MSYLSIRNELQPYMGKQIIDCRDRIETIAKHHGLRLNVMDPEINKDIRIDNESDRLNVRTDANSVITSFTIG